jgi:hypothetical protein
MFTTGEIQSSEAFAKAKVSQLNDLLMVKTPLLCGMGMVGTFPNFIHFEQNALG